MCCCIDPPEAPCPMVNIGGPNSSMKCSLIFATVSADLTSSLLVPITLSDPAATA
jgi:hypothetical protein